jgi:hypothetical protein
MKKNIIYILIFLTISTRMASGQVNREPTKVLEKLYGRLVNNYDDNERIRINDSVRAIIDDYVTSDTVFSHRFKSLRYLGQVTSPDSLLKIITWNLVLTNSPSKYFCYIILKQDTVKANKIFRLSAVYTENPVKTDTVYSYNDWYGALYYDIKPYTINNKKLWILLGIDYGNPFISRKIIDVLNFTQNDSIEFGRKWFDTNGNLKFREVFEYASNGMMSLRFGTDSLIVFDHLVPFSPAQENDRQYYGPDYSIDGYYFKDGLWRLKINIDARNKE